MFLACSKRVRHQSSTNRSRLLESGLRSVCWLFSSWYSAVRNGRRVFEWSPFYGPLDRFAASQGFCLWPFKAPYSCSCCCSLEVFHLQHVDRTSYTRVGLIRVKGLEAGNSAAAPPPPQPAASLAIGPRASDNGYEADKRTRRPRGAQCPSW